MINNKIKVLAVVPGHRDDTKMIFSKDQIKSLVSEGIDVYDCYLTSRTNILVIIKEFCHLVRMAKKVNPCCIHAHFGTVTSFVCALLSLITNIPLVITFHGSDLNSVSSSIDGYFRNIGQKVMSNLSALRATKIICVSERLVQQLWWRKKCAIVIPVGVNLELFKALDKNHVRRLLGWGSEEYVILFCDNNNSKIKRLDIALSTFNLLKQKIRNVRFEVLNNVKHELIPLYLNGSDCLLLCSDSEGSPCIVKEAMACNLPIVSTDVGDVAVRLQGVYPSKIVKKKPEALADAIAKIIKVNQRSNGRGIIERDLSETFIANKIISVYQNIVVSTEKMR